MRKIAVDISTKIIRENPSDPLDPRAMEMTLIEHGLNGLKESTRINMIPYSKKSTKIIRENPSYPLDPCSICFTTKLKRPNKITSPTINY